MDVFKALALGADAVCVGQHLIPALKENGTSGVAQEICQMSAQLRSVMARTGAHSLSDIDASVIWHKEDWRSMSAFGQIIKHNVDIITIRSTSRRTTLGKRS